LFNILKKIGYKQKFKHLGYESVTLPDGAMSSRSGNVITYAELKEKMLKHTLSETKKRNPDWTEAQIKKVANSLAIGAMKFEMLKVGPEQIITFDIKKALSFEGFSAVYIQYAYARATKVLSKTKKQFYSLPS
jgi:arginyl-tRNA synthetase